LRALRQWRAKSLSMTSTGGENVVHARRRTGLAGEHVVESGVLRDHGPGNTRVGH
jgi:hypothetical protein